MPDLVIPDPRHHPVPAGWWEDVFTPWVEAQTDWVALDHAEATIRQLLSYMEAFEADQLELRKAWRMIEIRRGELLAPRSNGGRGKTVTRPEGLGNVTDASLSRYRTIAEHKDDVVLPALRAAKRPYEASQNAILEAIKVKEQKPAQRKNVVVGRSGYVTVEVDDLCVVLDALITDQGFAIRAVLPCALRLAKKIDGHDVAGEWEPMLPSVKEWGAR